MTVVDKANSQQTSMVANRNRAKHNLENANIIMRLKMKKKLFLKELALSQGSPPKKSLK